MTSQIPQPGVRPGSFLDYMRIVRRRLGVVLLPLVIVPAISLFVSHQQTAEYKATATTLLSHVNLGASLSGLPQDTSATSSPDRALATEAALARTTTVAEAVVKATRVALTPGQFLSISSVQASNDADLIDVSVKTASQALSIRLATEYAHQFAAYSNKIAGSAVRQAYADVTQRLGQLRASHQTGTALYATLRARQQQIIALEALQTPSLQVFKEADAAPKVAPQPKRAVLIGLLAGIVVAVGFLLLSEAVDTRVRDVDEIEATVGIPLLARIPPAMNRLGRRSTGTPGDHDDHQAEAYRMLRTNLSFLRLAEPFQTLLVTSPQSTDGKTTTVAALGVAFARSGVDVVVADLDARKPELTKMLEQNPRSGLTEVAFGITTLDSALAEVQVGPPPLSAQIEVARQTGAANGAALGSQGRLRLLSFGRLRPPSPHEFVASAKVREVLHSLAGMADLVIIDSAPILRVGDSFSLSGSVDAVLFVAKRGSTTRGDLRDLGRIIEASPARALGVVVTNAEVHRGYGYGYGYAYPDEPQPAQPGRTRQTRVAR